MADTELTQAHACAAIRNRYVYRIDHVTEVDANGVPLPIYIGKGTGIRDRLSGRRNEGVAALIKAGLAQTPVRVADCLTEREALAEERRLILFYGRRDLGTGCLENRDVGGVGLAHSLKMRDPTTRAKISAAMSGKPKSPEHRAKISAIHRGWIKPGTVAAHRGKKRPAETRVKMSTSHQGVPKTPHSPETRAIMRAAKLGKAKSPQHAAKLAALLTERNRSPQMRAIHLGRKHTPEELEKMGSALRNLWANPLWREKQLAARRLALAAKRADPRASDSEKPLSP